MAATAEGRALTEAHRRAQLAIRAQAIADVLALWPMLDPKDVDAAFPAFSRAASALIEARRGQSAGTAAAYYRAFRKAEGAKAADLREIIRTVPIPTAQVQTSLLVTGPVRIKQETRRGATPEKAAEKALVAVSGAAARLVLDGGRQALSEAVRRDPAAIGYARVTDGDPCSFCAMLAARGAVYSSAAAASSVGNSKDRGRVRGARKPGSDFHDHCGCSTEPIFREDAALPGRADEFAALYKEHAEGVADPLNAFRRAYEAQRRSS